jgi:predicted transcriptional regulator
MDKIERFGYTMREMGVWETLEQEEHNSTIGQVYAKRAERYRNVANTLRSDIRHELDISQETTNKHMSDDEDKANKAHKLYEQYEDGKMTAEEAITAIIGLFT